MKVPCNYKTNLFTKLKLMNFAISKLLKVTSNFEQQPYHHIVAFPIAQISSGLVKLDSHTTGLFHFK